MLNQMKAMGALAGLLRDKERIKEITDRVQDTLETVRVVGESGSGAVRVTVSGKLRIESVEMDPAMAAGLAAGDDSRVMGQKLIEDAVNDALEKARVVIQSEMSKVAEELGLPDVPGLGSLLGTG